MVKEEDVNLVERVQSRYMTHVKLMVKDEDSVSLAVRGV